MKKRPGRQYPRGTVFNTTRELVWERAGGICEVTGLDLFIVIHGEDCTDGQCDTFDDGYCKVVRRWACHHVVAERFVRLHFKGVSPHIIENNIAIIPSLHSKITAAENKLMKADWLGYRTELHRLGMDLSILDRAWSALCAAEKK